MHSYIAMIRGVNVGGQKAMRMENLRQGLTDLGFSRVKTYLQSGNAVFQYTAAGKQELTQRIETQIEQLFGYHALVFLFKESEFKKILLSNPFINERKEDQSKLYATFMYQALSQNLWDQFTPPKGISDELAVREGVIYLYCPGGYGRTRLSNTFFETRLGVLTTTRNWNTVKALNDLVREEQA
jgi:uncharacterized protein (DUF1697 family)